MPPRQTLQESDSCSFCQAEDGIRAVAVTGVQTCALPIVPWLGTLAGGLLLAVAGGFGLRRSRRRAAAAAAASAGAESAGAESAGAESADAGSVASAAAAREEGARAGGHRLHRWGGPVRGGGRAGSPAWVDWPGGGAA